MNDVEADVDGLSLDRLTDVYIKIRDARSALKRQFDTDDGELRGKLDLISERLLEYCATNGVESARTQHGTFFRKVRNRYWATDWGAVHAFVLENKMPELFEKRLSQGTMKQLAEEDGVVVPGVNVDSEYVVTVRRSK